MMTRTVHKKAMDGKAARGRPSTGVKP